MPLRLLAAAFALMVGAGPALAEVSLRLTFAYLDSGTGAVPAPRISATSLYRQAPLEVLAPELAPEGRAERVVTLTDADFDGPFARLRLALGGLRLPQDDARADRELSFAFEVILRRDQVGPEVDLTVPVIVSSRRDAMKPFLADPPVAEDLPGRFFIAQQYMAAYHATPEAVSAAPASFAPHRLIARAMADFALKLTGQAANGVQLLPAEEMARDIGLYWQTDREAQQLHLRAYADARSFPWMALAEVEKTLSAARRGGVESVRLCNEAVRMLDHFDRRRPDPDDARRVDLLFPVPGSLEGYLQGRRLDVRASCGRPKI